MRISQLLPRSRRAKSRIVASLLVAISAAAAIVSTSVVAQAPPPAPSANELDVFVDTALLVSVDVSNSVDAERYRLQMEGIASALEDPGVIDAITSGPNGSILFSMVTWADRPTIALSWTRIASKEDATAVAAKVRSLPQIGGEFTCMTRMLRTVHDKIVPQIPARALRTVVDVSGDGPDNCNADEPIEIVRDQLVATGVTINGLPILEGAGSSAGVATSQPNFPTSGGLDLKAWYESKVKGGSGSFVLPADGFKDFGRAIRQKFVIEISGVAPGSSRDKHASVSNVRQR